MKPRSVQLIDGPLKGRYVFAIGFGTLALEDESLTDGIVARYLPTRDLYRYRFVGLATVLARLERVA